MGVAGREMNVGSSGAWLESHGGTGRPSDSLALALHESARDRVAFVALTVRVGGLGQATDKEATRMESPQMHHPATGLKVCMCSRARRAQYDR